MRKLLTIRVPASTANLGPGFDSVGLALAFGLTVDVYPAGTGDASGAGVGSAAEGVVRVTGASRAGASGGAWRVEFVDAALRGLPKDENNLIVSTALLVAAERRTKLPPCRLVVKSDIPLARGLGSSAAAIVAGVALANELGGLGLSREEWLALATRVEGHPDNVAAAIHGGLIVAASGGSAVRGAVSGAGPGGMTLVRVNVPPADVVLCIPDYPVRTEEARAVLPSTLPFRDAVRASARSNVLIAALLTGDWGRAGRMMSGDLFHEPYREVLLPDLARMREVVWRSDAYGAALSGSGPTFVTFTPAGRGAELGRQFTRVFPHFEVRVTSVARRGATVSGRAG